MIIIGIKLAPGDHESNFKKVGPIPYGCNTKGTALNSWWSESYDEPKSVNFYTILYLFSNPDFFSERKRKVKNNNIVVQNVTLCGSYKKSYANVIC